MGIIIVLIKGSLHLGLQVRVICVKIIAQLEEEEKSLVFKMVDTFLTQKKFKDFFNKNVAVM